MLFVFWELAIRVANRFELKSFSVKNKNIPVKLVCCLPKMYYVFPVLYFMSRVIRCYAMVDGSIVSVRANTGTRSRIPIRKLGN